MLDISDLIDEYDELEDRIAELKQSRDDAEEALNEAETDPVDDEEAIRLTNVLGKLELELEEAECEFGPYDELRMSLGDYWDSNNQLLTEKEVGDAAADFIDDHGVSDFIQRYIDMESFTRDFLHDYTCVEWDGTDYYYQA